MDTERVRTFLEIVRSGSFIEAAERLHVTQTTVSARIKSLESELRKQLFVRNRKGARLTPAGAEFRPYAESFLQVWERARQQVAVPTGKRGYVAVGGELSLWDPLLLNWILRMRRTEHDIALRGTVALPEQLIEQLRTGTLDIAVMYAPHHEAGTTVELLFQETLVLVTAARGGERERIDLDGGVPESYVYVDWGPDFAQHHGARFPGWSEASVHVGLGPLGLNFILSTGGCGYFRLGVVRRFLANGELVIVENAPTFEHPAFAVFADGNTNAALGPAIVALRECAMPHPPSGG